MHIDPRSRIRIVINIDYDDGAKTHMWHKQAHHTDNHSKHSQNQYNFTLSLDFMRSSMNMYM